MAERAPAIDLIDADIPRAGTAAAAVALPHVNWKINCGEFWAVGAEPGEGKTDLLCTAAALRRPLKGVHLIFGADIRGMDEQELVECHQKVAMVFDSGRLFPHLTVAENLQLPLAYHMGGPTKEVAERVSTVLEATGLQDFRDSHPRHITRNLHQRAGLARALALDPEVLVVDSPLSVIDPRQARWWLEFLGQLHQGHPLFGQRPLTIIVTADDFRPWTGVAGHFAVIKDRKFQVIGGREDVRNARDAAVQELLSLSPD